MNQFKNNFLISVESTDLICLKLTELYSQSFYQPENRKNKLLYFCFWHYPCFTNTELKLRNHEKDGTYIHFTFTNLPTGE